MASRTAPVAAPPTLVLVDAGMVAGFRRPKLSLAQLHQALVHLHRQHPDVKVAVVADPSVKWDFEGEEQAAFEGDILARAIVCAPAGALAGTAGFLEGAARQGTSRGYSVVAFTALALPDVALGRLRNESGRWVWDLDGARAIDAGQAKAAASVRPKSTRRRSR